jgi:hypothetical protein
MTKAREIAELGQKLTVDGSGNIEIAGDVSLPNGSSTSNRITLGNSDDTKFFHNGVDGYWMNDTGQLIIRNLADDKDVKIESDNGSGGTTEYFRADGSIGQAQMFYYGTKKFHTTSAGVDVTGTLVSDGLTVDGNPVFNGSSPQLFFQTGATHYNWQLAAQENISGAFEIGSGGVDADATNDTYTTRFVIESDGDIRFGDSSNYTWIRPYEASTGNLVISADNGGTGTNGSAIKFRTRGADKMIIEHSGSVGINKTSPSSSYKLDISGNMRLTGTAGTIRLEADDTSLDTNQLVGRVEMYANDASVGGAGVAGFVEVKSDDQYGVNTYMTLGTRISDGTGNATERFRITKQGGFISKPTTDGVVVLNQNGADADFRVESFSNSNMLVMDASASRFGVGAAPSHLFHATGTQSGDWISLIENTHNSNGYGLKVKAGDNNDVQPFRVANTSNDTLFYVAGGGRVVFNDVQNTTGDVNIKGNTMSGLFYADVSANRIGINTATPNSLLQVNGEAEFNRARVVDNGSSSPLFNIKSDDASPWAFQMQNDTYDISETYGFRGYVNNDNNVFFQTNGNGGYNYIQFAQRNNSTTVGLLDLGRAGATVFNEDGADMDFRVESDSDTHALFVNAGNNSVSIGTSSNPPSSTLNQPKLRVGSPAHINGLTYGDAANIGSGKVFTLSAASNGGQAYIRIIAANHNGVREQTFYYYNLSGTWTRRDGPSNTSGTPPTFTFVQNTGGTATITVTGAGSNPTYFNGGFMQYQYTGGFQLSS